MRIRNAWTLALATSALTLAAPSAHSKSRRRAGQEVVKPRVDVADQRAAAYNYDE